MKRFLKRLLMICIFLMVFTCLPGLVHAQPDPCDDPLDTDNPACPIDGGLTALLAIGVGYGIKKVREARNG